MIKKKIDLFENKLITEDILDISKVNKNESYKLSFESDGRCNIFLLVKNDKIQKKIKPVSQIVKGRYSYIINPPFDGTLILEAHDPGNTNEKWSKLTNIILESI